MATLTLRQAKGSPLTNSELDANFSNLNTELGTKLDLAGVRSAISVSGSLSYNASTGVISFSDAVTSVSGRTGAVSLTNSDVGLGNVENKSSSTIRSEITSANVTAALGYTPYSSSNPNSYITSNDTARTIVNNNGVAVGNRRAINFIPGSGISLSIADDSANEEIDVTIASSLGNSVVSSFNTRVGAVSLTSADVEGALGFTPASTQALADVEALALAGL